MHKPQSCLLLFCLLVPASGCGIGGCGGTPTPPPGHFTPAPVARGPHTTYMLNVEFTSVAAAKSAGDSLKQAVQGIATVENGPFPVPNTPLVRFAVSVGQDAPPDPVVAKIRTVAGVKNVVVAK